MSTPSYEVFSFVEKHADRLNADVLIYDLWPLQSQSQGQSVRWQVVTGESVVVAAERNNVDLIVMSEPLSTNSQFTLQTGIRDTLVEAHCPVLIFNDPD